ncbi:MAG TPA: FtsX-like permease family protein [Candidatus Dormibacteraeota bacterium]
MDQVLPVLGGLFILVYATLGIVAWRRPLLLRFAARESTRRPGQFALLVVGLMVGSTSITASLVAAESFTRSTANVLNQRLGAVDLTVTASGGRSFSQEVAQRLASDPALSPYVDGVQAGIEVPASVTDLDQRLGKPGVLVVGFDPASQKRFGAYALADGRRTYGTELASGDVLLSSALATALDAKPGDRLRISSGTAGSTIDLRVYGTAVARGPGTYGSYFAVFVPLATAQRVTGDTGVNVVRIAARGGNATDLEAARRAVSPLRAAVARIPSGSPLAVNEVRVDAAQQLEIGTNYVLGTTLAVSMLSVLAAIALIVNLVLALAEERRPRLAVMRALGLTRTGLVQLAVLEGAIYSVAAAAAGIAMGALVGLFLASQLWAYALIDPTAQPFLGFALQPSVRPVTLAVAFATGALVTLGTVAGAAYRTSRMAIAAAIRDLPEPASAPPQSWWRAGLLVVLGAIGLAMLVPPDPRARLVGGVVLIVTVVALARGRVPDRTRATLAGVLLTAWAAVVAASTPSGSDLGRFMLPLFGAVLITGAGLGIAAAANLRLLDFVLGLLGTRFGRLQATLRPPLAYLSRRPVRTGLTTSAFALVLVLVTLVAVFVAAGQARNYDRDSAGFDVQVVTGGSGPIQLPPEIAREVRAQLTIPMRVYQGPYNGSAFGGAASSATRIFYVLPDEPQLAAPLYLSSRDKRFASDAEVWQAVRNEPGLVIADWGSGLAPGEEITLMGVSGQLHLRVAAGSGSTILSGVVASPATMALIDTRPAGSTILLKTRSGLDPRALAHEIERALYGQGVQATSTHDILDQDYDSGIGYIVEYDTLLHLGLLVGVLALAMVLIRATVERRRTIGILRALGYQPRNVVAGLVTETLITATIGAVTGVTAGLFIGYFLIEGLAPGHLYGVDLARLGVALAIVYGTVLAVTGPLASRAARMAPTEAIRMTG